MRLFVSLFREELRLLLRSRSARAGLALLVLCGGAAVAAGKSTVDARRAALARLPALMEEERDYLLRGNPSAAADAGGVLYDLRHPTAHVPSAWASLSAGLRDTAPYALRARLLGVEGQRYDGGLANPEAQSWGGFDLAFVLAVLAPLWLLALLHDAVTAERESGLWDLVRAQPASSWIPGAAKVSARAAAVWTTSLALLAAGALWAGAEIDGRWFSAAAALTASLLFWTVPGAFAARFGRSSAGNAAALAGAWCLLAVVLPGAVNLGTSAWFPVPEGLELTVRQRWAYHAGWDRPKADTLAPYRAGHPELDGYPVPEDKFTWAWYFAMHERADESVKGEVSGYFSRLRRRAAWTRRLAWLSPPLALCLHLDRLAGTDLETHLDYLESVGEYHGSLKAFYGPWLFRNAPAAEVDWSGVPVHRFEGGRHAPGA